MTQASYVISFNGVWQRISNADIYEVTVEAARDGGK